MRQYGAKFSRQEGGISMSEKIYKAMKNTRSTEHRQLES